MVEPIRTPTPGEAMAQAVADEERDRPLENIAAFNGAAMEAFSEACRIYAGGLNALNSEFTAFVTKRLKHDADLEHDLAHCRDWEDISRLQQAWAETAAQEYFAEAGKLMEMAATMASESWQPLSEKAAEALKKAD